MSVMGVNFKTLRLLKMKCFRDISASCLSGGNELCGPVSPGAPGRQNCSEDVRGAGVCISHPGPAVS